jgi:hypothetical protein
MRRDSLASSDIAANRPPGPSYWRWAALVIAACLIAPASLFVHDYMLTWLHVPYPKEVGLPVWTTVLGLGVRLVALAVICRIASPILRRGSPLLVAGAIGIVLVMLNETLRVIIIDSVILDSWPYAILDGTPNAVALGLEVSIVAYAERRGVRWPGLLAIIVLVAVIGAAFARPWLIEHLGNWRDAHFGDVEEHYKDPYPPKVMVVIYATFLEATAGAFVLVALCWENLRGNRVRRIVAFAMLLLLVRGRVTLLLLNSFWVQQPLPTAFLATGQFVLETMALGLLVGTAWEILRPWRSHGST